MQYDGQSGRAQEEARYFRLESVSEGGKKSTPTVAILDRQSIRPTGSRIQASVLVTGLSIVDSLGREQCQHLLECIAGAFVAGLVVRLRFNRSPFAQCNVNRQRLAAVG